MAVFTDQMQRKVEVNVPPQRIVSLVPSQTELLHELNLGNRVVGITKFCIHPQSWFQSKPRVGGTKNVHFDRVAELQPDLIIGNKEENEQSQIEALAKQYPVWMSDITDLRSALQMIKALGAVTGTTAAALALADEIALRFKQLSQPVQPLSAAYFIWRGPYMVAGANTFINTMLLLAGFSNVFANTPSRYPEVNEAQLQAANPAVILLSSEPYPFNDKHIAELQQLCPNAQIQLVDGELFSWYGSRLLHTPAYLRQLQSTCS